MKRFVLFFSLCIMSLSVLHGQTLLRRATIAYEEENYPSAIKSYQKYYDKKKKDYTNVILPLANSHFYLNQFESAESYYAEALADDYSALDYYNYAELLRMKKSYEESIDLYEKGIGLSPDSDLLSRLELGMKSSQWAIDNYDKKVAESVTILPTSLPTGGQSLGITPVDSGIVFSTVIKGPKNLMEDVQGRPVLNLGFAPKEDGNFAESYSYSENLTSEDYIGSTEFSSDGNTIYYTRIVKVGKVKRLKLYSAVKNSQTQDWVREQELSFCDDEFNYAHPALSKDGRTLYFSSDMTGTLGGMDIFKASKSGSKWVNIKNIGKTVNTAATEVFPYVSPSGYLSFASNGHPGFGGLDAFWVSMKNGRPFEIFNAYRPINSSYDDFAAVIDPSDTLVAYLSSSRSSKGRYDEIYKIEITDDYMNKVQGIKAEVVSEDTVELSKSILAESSVPVVSATGSDAKVVEPNTSNGNNYSILTPTSLYGIGETGIVNTYMFDVLFSKPLANSSFTIIDKISNQVIVRGLTDSNGAIKLDLKNAGLKIQQAIQIEVIDETSEFSKFTLSIVSDRLKNYDSNNPIFLTPIMKKRDKIKGVIVADERTTRGAPFDFDSSSITSAGAAYLDAWVDFLLKNRNVKIKLMTHTDNRGDVAYNFKLSQRRAFEAKRYLITRGVNHMQVISRGYGERYPYVDCQECTEEEHEANRRIEIEVINIR